MRAQYPLVFSTLLIRLAVGVAIVHILTSLGSDTIVPDWFIAILGIGSIGTGIVLSMMHLGRPKRFLNSFANPKSMLTLEAYFIPPLLVCMAFLGAGYFFDQMAWLNVVGKIGTVVFGVILIFVTAKVYHLKARPTWATPLVVYEFFLSTICLGLLGYVGLVPFFGQMVGTGLLYLTGFAMIVLAVEFIITIYYRYYIQSVSQTAAEVLRDSSAKVQFYSWIGLGLVLPFALCTITLITKNINGALVLACFLSFFLGALLWRALFFETSTPLKITPDIAEI